MEKPKLLLDENIGSAVTNYLRGKGYDVISMLEEGSGAEDMAVLKKALEDDRIVVTLDKDFGRLVYFHSQKHAGVILLRLRDEFPQNMIQVLHKILAEYSLELTRKFTIVTDTKIRMR